MYGELDPWRILPSMWNGGAAKIPLAVYFFGNRAEFALPYSL
jgi:hypothetical protein